MKRKATVIYCLFVFALSSVAQGRMLNNVELANVVPQGWLRIMMESQKANFTGKLDEIGFPFTQGGWGSEPFTRTKNGVTSGFWVPYEQTAYYYDGMIRCGLLLNSSELIAQSRTAIYNSIKNASKEGIIEPIMANGDMRRWPHSVFFRAMMAEYESTHNPVILEGLQKHFRNDTVKYEGRDLCNIETIVWLYRNTNDKYYYDKALQLKGNLFSPGETLDDYMNELGRSSRQELHAVTYHEILKTPILYYELTGDKKYIDIARSGFKKLDEFHMLPDGVVSSEEGLSDKSSKNTHEMCNVIDYMWTCAYMLKATREVEWCDRIERVLFNAGIGGITKNFDAHQYYSSPNQVVCADHSSPISTYEGSRLAFRQIHRPPCCTGNLNRMFPVYVGSQWMKDDKGALYKMLYGAGEVVHKVSDSEVTLREESTYPFGDMIKIKVVSGKAKFPLYICVPSWCKAPKVSVNGVEQSKVKANEFCVINRLFSTGDVIEIALPKYGEYKQWDHESMVVNYGPLLFALPVESNTTKVDVHTPKLQANTYKGYTMSAKSDWNYILGVGGETDSAMKVIETPIDMDSNPWASSVSPIKIIVPAYKDPAWRLEYTKITTPSGDEIFAPVTPALPARGSMIYALNGLSPEAIELVPYGRTLLRISMFPYWKQGEIPAEVLATENK